MKTCSKCGEEKELGEFPKRAKAVDGLNGKCKKCLNTAWRKSYKEKDGRRKAREYAREYRKTDAGKERDKRAHRRYLMTNIGKKNKRAATKRWGKTEKGRAYKKECDIARRRDPRNIEKQKAQTVICHLVESGKLSSKGKTCAMISSECIGPLVAHHPDYSKPRDIVWLCRYHHSFVHGQVKYPTANVS